LTEDPTLAVQAQEAIRDPGATVVVSAATVWEASIKTAAGRMTVPRELAEQVVDEGFEALPITFRHASAAAALPRHHGDPFDRVLVAQAQLEALILVTRDRRLALYGVPTLAA